MDPSKVTNIMDKEPYTLILKKKISNMKEISKIINLMEKDQYLQNLSRIKVESQFL